MPVTASSIPSVTPFLRYRFLGEDKSRRTLENSSLSPHPEATRLGSVPPSCPVSSQQFSPVLHRVLPESLLTPSPHPHPNKQDEAFQKASLASRSASFSSQRVLEVGEASAASGC